MTQYKKIAKAYTDSERLEHPQRKYMIYPTWLNTCGDVREKKVLDLGCGGGDSSRMLAQKGAVVIGIDKEPEMIKIAKKIEEKNPLGINYIIADAGNLPVFQKEFDLITPTYLLHYATTKKELKNIIESIVYCLKSNGKMVAINQNPEQPVISYFKGGNESEKWLGQPFIEGSVIEVTIYKKNGKKLCSFINCFWRKKTYEKFLQKAGFSDIQWIKPKMNKLGQSANFNWRELEKTTITIITATLERK